MIAYLFNSIQFPAWDTKLFLFLNSLHHPYIDPVMKAFSAQFLWIPLYLAIAFFMVRKSVWPGVMGILFIGLCFALTDQLSVILFKNVFLRLRPCYEPEIQAVMHQIEHCGGQYGFISNHAANTFGLAIFTSLFFRVRWYTISIFVWAAIVAYSRIYVGKHYPLDIFCGAAFGALMGFLTFRLYLFAMQKISKRKESCQ